MGSNYFGYPSMGNDRRTDVGGSSRKDKKGGSDKPKQPQRGLGVAQLEKIRLHGQLGGSNLHPSHHNSYHSSFNQDDISVREAAYPSSYFSSPSPASYNYNTHFLMGNGYEKTDDEQPANISSWISGTTGSVLEFPPHTRQMTTPDFLNFNMEANSQDNNNNSNANCSINKQNFEEQELDLELRLSR